MKPDKRVLVTGAGGFIGRTSLEPLRTAGYEVHAVLSARAAAAHGPAPRDPAPRDRAPPALHTHHADLLEGAQIEALIAAVRPSHLLHFAWIAAPGVYWNSPENRRWLDASRHLLACFQRGGGVRVVMAGSCAEYDWSRAGVCEERSSPLAGDSTAEVSAYAACKVAMQRSLEAFARAHRLSAAWGRIFFQFGPHEHPRRLIASVILDLLQGRAALCTQGTQIRSFLHVADVGAAFAAILESRFEGVVNVGSPERTSIAALLARLAEQVGRPDLLRLGAREMPPGEPALLVPDPHRLLNEVGFRPSFTLASGLADTVRWWRTALGAHTPSPASP